MFALRPSRRSVLTLLTAAGAASAAGAYFWTKGPVNFIGEILQRQLPGLRTNAASIAALSSDVQAALFKTLDRRLGLEAGAFASSVVGVEALAHFKLTSTQFSRLERVVITFFILGSNYLDVKNPTTELVTYYTPSEVCPNPWAQFNQ
jgi:hypothetical protein